MDLRFRLLFLMSFPVVDVAHAFILGILHAAIYGWLRLIDWWV